MPTDNETKTPAVSTNALLSKTPRTDAAIFRIRVEEDPPATIPVVAAELACEMEIEIAKLRAELARRIIVPEVHLEMCAQAIADFDRVTPRPLTAKDQAWAVLAALANQ